MFEIKKLICLYIFFVGTLAFANKLEVSIRKCNIPLSVEPMSIESITTNRYRVDFKVDIENTTGKTLKINSLLQPFGYYQLKLVATDGEKEYWISKQPRKWSSTYLSYLSIEPYEKYTIPVSFSSDLWQIDKIKDSEITGIRAFFDQPYWDSSTNLVDNIETSVWFGIASSPYYNITNILREQTISNIWYGKSYSNNSEHVKPVSAVSLKEGFLSSSNILYNIDFDDDIGVDISFQK